MCWGSVFLRPYHMNFPHVIADFIFWFEYLEEGVRTGRREFYSDFCRYSRHFFGEMISSRITHEEMVWLRNRIGFPSMS